MDRAITASDANQRFSEVLRDVQEGVSFIVTSRGRPVARVSPVDDAERQRAGIDALLTFVTTLPRRQGKSWRRADLYE